jgi:hypothetical protein
MSKTQMKHIAFSKDELQLIDEIIQARKENDRKVFGDKFVEKEIQKGSQGRYSFSATLRFFIREYSKIACADLLSVLNEKQKRGRKPKLGVQKSSPNDDEINWKKIVFGNEGWKPVKL